MKMSNELLYTSTFCTVCLHISQEGLEVSWMEHPAGNRHLLLCHTKLSSPQHPRSFLQTWMEHYCQGVIKILLIVFFVWLTELIYCILKE